MVFVDFQAVQKRVEELLKAVSAASAPAAPIKVAYFGQEPDEATPYWVQYRSMKIVPRERQQDPASSDVVDFEVMLQISVTLEKGHAQRSEGSTHGLSYVATAVRTGLEGRGTSNGGLVTHITMVETDLGNMLDLLTQSPIGMVTVRGVAIQQVTGTMEAPGDPVDVVGP